MSQGVQEYYANLAEMNNFSSEIPSILSGKPQLLLPVETELSIWGPAPKLAEEVKGNYAAILDSLSPYLIACAMDEPQEGKKSRTKVHDEGTYSRYLDNMISDHLKPSYLSTGKLVNVQTQAVAPSEISIRATRKALSSNRERADVALSKWVFLVTSAEYKPKTVVANVGYTAFITLAHASVNGTIVCNSRQFTLPELQHNPEQWRPVRFPTVQE
jgi:hypothetical protein